RASSVPASTRMRSPGTGSTARRSKPSGSSVRDRLDGVRHPDVKCHGRDGAACAGGAVRGIVPVTRAASGPEAGAIMGRVLMIGRDGALLEALRGCTELNGHDVELCRATGDAL